MSVKHLDEWTERQTDGQWNRLLAKHIKDERWDGQTDGWTDGQTEKAC